MPNPGQLAYFSSVNDNLHLYYLPLFVKFNYNFTIEQKLCFNKNARYFFFQINEKYTCSIQFLVSKKKMKRE
jgi:hypothetical protein